MKYLAYQTQRVLRFLTKANCVRYPLFENPADLKLSKNIFQQSGIQRLLGKLKNGDYIRLENPCLCGNSDRSQDELISRMDMHAIDLNVLLCWKCGLIRSADAFDIRSNASYYKCEYREIHSGGISCVEDYFDSQLDRGSSFLDILNRTGVIHELESIAEIGCGSGGVLHPFHLIGKQVSGYDYDDEFLQFGRNKGMHMVCLGENSRPNLHFAPDLLILSHVIEHFLNPRVELMQLIGQIKPGKYLIAEVPGVFALSTRKALRGYPVRYFQIAHVIQFFYREYLDVFYRAFGLEIIYGDETATFVLRKPLAWEPRTPGDIYADKLARYPSLIDRYIKDTYFDYRYGFNRDNFHWYVSSMLDRLGLRGAVKKLVRR